MYTIVYELLYTFFKSSNIIRVELLTVELLHLLLELLLDLIFTEGAIRLRSLTSPLLQRGAG